jgi:hypothetical protein
MIVNGSDLLVDARRERFQYDFGGFQSSHLKVNRNLGAV